MIINSENRVGGIYKFPPETSNQEIIKHILSDFALKLYWILKQYKDPGIGCADLCTYTIFRNFWEIDNSKDISLFGEEIYSGIPSDQVSKEIWELSKGEVRGEEVRRSFGSGEFPRVKIWKGYHERLDEFHVTYNIMR